jgi:hypothetical protein
VDAVKLGEWPAFSPRTPSRVMSIVGQDRELFLKGRRAELEGLGVGAFAYYRRVVENQHGRLLNEIIRVAKRIEAPAEVVDKLQRAATETQFTKSVDMVKDAIPAPLLVDGHHNPLTLLHTSLSDGLHNQSDEECLKLAQAIRVILFELCERLGRALEDRKELNSSLNQLLNRKA